MRRIICDRQLNIIERGTGTPSPIFLHYFAGSSGSWSEVMIQLQETAHCIAPDLPGFGDSQPIAERTVEAIAMTIAEMIRQLDRQHYILIGHSMGGKVALATFDRVVQGNLRSSQEAWQAWLECGSRRDISSAMTTITVPVLVIVGAEDSVIPQALQQEVVDLIANAQLVVVPNAGHSLPIEAPQAIAELIQTKYFDPA